MAIYTKSLDSLGLVLLLLNFSSPLWRFLVNLDIKTLQLSFLLIILRIGKAFIYSLTKMTVFTSVEDGFGKIVSSNKRVFYKRSVNHFFGQKSPKNVSKLGQL